MQKTFGFLLVALLLTCFSISINANKYTFSAKGKKGSGNGLNSLLIYGEAYVIDDGIGFYCKHTGFLTIEIKDGKGEIVYRELIFAQSGQTYLFFIPGLNPDEDVIINSINTNFNM